MPPSIKEMPSNTTVYPLAIVNNHFSPLPSKITPSSLKFLRVKDLRISISILSSS